MRGEGGDLLLFAAAWTARSPRPPVQAYNHAIVHDDVSVHPQEDDAGQSHEGRGQQVQEAAAGRGAVEAAATHVHIRTEAGAGQGLLWMKSAAAC